MQSLLMLESGVNGHYKDLGMSLNCPLEDSTVDDIDSQEWEQGISLLLDQTLECTFNHVSKQIPCEVFNAVFDCIVSTIWDLVSISLSNLIWESVYAPSKR